MATRIPDHALARRHSLTAYRVYALSGQMLLMANSQVSSAIILS